MENISKNITLECAKNRFYGNYMPALDSETLSPITNIECWGDFPYDVIIESGDLFDIFSLKDRLPLLCDNGKYIFRFGNIARLYGWLKRIARETVFYKLVIRRGQYKWIEVEQEFFDSGVTFEMYDMSPSISTSGNTMSGEVCEIIAVHPEADTFNYYFRPSGTTERCELNFKNFVDNIFSGANDYNFRTPYIDLPLTITEDVNSVGELLCDENIWKPNKKYYVGDIVRYEDDYYVLEHGENTDKFNVTGNLYNIVNQAFISGEAIYNFINEIPENLDDLSKDKLNMLYDDSAPTNFWIVQAFYKGKYDPDTMLTSFDDEHHSHWVKIEPKVITNNHNYDDGDIFIVSELDDFRSVRKSYDSDGQELPFNVIDIINEYGELIGYDVALIYSLGYTNYSLKDNGACADFLKEVTFMRDLSDSGDTIVFDGVNKDIIISDKLEEGYSYIKFGYYSGCHVIDSGDTQTVDEQTGVHYEETRSIEVVTENVKYSGDTETEFTYFSLSELTEESKECNPNKACAKVVFDRDTIYSIPFHVFSNGKLFGSTFVESSEDELQISRGIYAAFERHNILGEINSMDDLKNYRNNYFKL